MDTPKKEDEKNKNYSEITEEDFRNGKLEIQPELSKDGEETGIYLITLEYGEQSDRMAVIALAKVNDKKSADQLKSRFSVLMNPTIKHIKGELNNIARTFEKSGFSWTRNGHDLLYDGKVEIESEEELKNDKNDKKVTGEEKKFRTNEFPEQIDEEVQDPTKDREQKLNKLSETIKGLNNEEKKKFIDGKESFYLLQSMRFINNPDILMTYKEAIKLEKSLNNIDGLSKEDIIRDMKQNTPEYYKRYEYLLKCEQALGDKESEQKEKIYVDKIAILLSNAEAIRNKVFENHKEQMSFFLKTVSRVGFSFNINDLDELLLPVKTDNETKNKSKTPSKSGLKEEPEL